MPPLIFAEVSARVLKYRPSPAADTPAPGRWFLFFSFIA
jgi:hypothetical protein